MKGKTGATGRRGAKGARGATGRPGPRGTRGPLGIQGLTGLAGTLHKAESLNRLVEHFEDVYQQLTTLAKRIADLEHRLGEISAARPNRH